MTSHCLCSKCGVLRLQSTPAPAASKRLYTDSIESLVRNKIQKMKIDMANEVIDAGRFDMQTSMAERKETLESLLQVHTSDTSWAEPFLTISICRVKRNDGGSICMLSRSASMSEQCFKSCAHAYCW